MAQTVLLPKLGQTVEEAAIVKWHKREGDKIAKGDVLFEIETDKAVLEAESFYAGTLLKILVKENETVPVSSVVAYIGEPGEKVPDKTAAPAPKPEPAAPAPQAAAGPAASPPPVPAVPVPAPVAVAQPFAAPAAVPAPQAARRLFITPRARALARASVIDPAPIAGSGPNGRIRVRDVEAYLAAKGYADLRITPAAKQLAAEEELDVLSVQGTGVAGRIMVEDVKRCAAQKPVKMTKMRRTIARRLTQSFTTTPHFYVTVSTDMTDLLTFRQELKEQGKAFKVTDFILEAVVMSLREYPAANSVTDGNTVRWHGRVQLGMAVGLDEGLVVPVIRDAEDLSMAELHAAAADLGKRARQGKLMPDEMIGSTFTVSNMGMLNVENFHAIINPGESAILAVASTIPTPAVRGGSVTVRAMMKMTLSVDHRIVDGTTGAAFVNAVRTKLEDVELWKRLTS